MHPSYHLWTMPQQNYILYLNEKHITLIFKFSIINLVTFSPFDVWLFGCWGCVLTSTVYFLNFLFKKIAFISCYFSTSMEVSSQKNCCCMMFMSCQLSILIIDGIKILA
ncbi:hypothetical protein KFK09_021407 [Dendrobium nobile]|uniref:Uncharacterized protein n=1 Tax=Dendrobium nobile TaxID=94219 RepID=A0A8T3ANK8_DENNO|nr:hypothetical protein KFK09_021407 [Dendrobium nobile]